MSIEKDTKNDTKNDAKKTHPFLAGSADHILLKVLLHPRSSRNSLSGVHDGRLKIHLTSPPVENAANQALIAFISKLLKVKKSALKIKSGSTSRRKTIVVEGVSMEEAAKALGKGITG